ncbi:hypothetical protein V8C42DRAFT_320162 [Trichoderma barbatum]
MSRWYQATMTLILWAGFLVLSFFSLGLGLTEEKASGCKCGHRKRANRMIGGLELGERLKLEGGSMVGLGWLAGTYVVEAASSKVRVQ